MSEQEKPKELPVGSLRFITDELSPCPSPSAGLERWDGKKWVRVDDEGIEDMTVWRQGEWKS